ncbi:MAG: S-layer homology domain-containing protein [Microcoleus sp. PH2017_15_JOR_U_A]|uniref:S-layer homology domain-containing protein n=1 Tax=unclassified Microcoleus TaxID=2642155 RepID=UPI001D84C06E|nr:MULTISPECIES: S-layer homology domain-containing protein [unclassified Microcoleus]MCC3472419.1 S-layer homology domain-containing protein [Microcoleus sp. PH2017_13_LAR_U_A]MCC3486983.1 S-layer homology domain-containing protein [Microcoleus sp. PH2017_14_LAR_D_A]MCC3496906.1 S-layer homology domain-containing protein [Microcoleus sp. PH2017_15_JOR_U_A]MCC3597475.1 S-layer homology domain-containing protein [Microcoleus sp. PH2017_26_ELK_O_A]MCC3622544.1 S-layer homology domain-containing 
MVRSHKRQAVIALVVALGIIIGNLVFPGLNVAPALAEAKFKDVKDHWAQACIEELAEKKIISGYYEDGTFRPNRPVSRAEFAAMLRRAFPDAKTVRNPIDFADIPTNYWGYKAIREAYQTGFMSGSSGSIFNATLNIPRWQVLVALSSGLKYTPAGSAPEILNATFEDARDIPELARNAIAAAAEKQLVVNYPAVKQLEPTRNATRAEVATFLCQAIAKPGKTALVPSQYIAQVPPNIGPPRTTEISEFGKVRAEVSFVKEAENAKNIRIKIIRDGKTLLEEPVLIPTRSLADNPDKKASDEVSEGRLLSVRIRDLDGDKEPEVLADLVSIKSGVRCCNYSFIYRYDSAAKKYTHIKHFWGNVSYEIVDFGKNDIPEFKSLDGRFAEAFTNYADSRLPLQIWQYRPGKMEDVTKQYPVEVYTNGAELWLESRKRSSEDAEVKGVLAAFMASKYVAGQEAEGWRLLEGVYQGRDRTQFFGKLREFLVNTGYASK